jgi:hypothetical protein
LPVGDFLRVHAVLVCMIFTGELQVEQYLTHTGTRVAKTGDPVNGINSQAEPVRLVADGEFQRCVDVPLFLIAPYMECGAGRGGGR